MLRCGSVLCRARSRGWQALGEYVFLKSLFKYIAEKCNCGSFGEISVIEPYIPKPDTCRIDLWVLGDDFAVIFENKAYNANDQEAQIRRYIDITLSEGYTYKGKVQKYTEDQIYVVYLPQTDAKDPDAQTWLNEGDDPYFDIRTNRYAKTSFRSVILTWLKEKVLVRNKDFFFAKFRSASMQWTCGYMYSSNAVFFPQLPVRDRKIRLYLL